ncbi:hypothetical protein [Pseudorhizobium halotolerans]|uniref:hypothetical protein n=1 Tax=Pseudorhizobium halotolerans TaxID=1233081 RepID=UPI001159CA77|nr:hypothetical protein [Pseudorhizobium halotolerans]
MGPKPPDRVGHSISDLGTACVAQDPENCRFAVGITEPQYDANPDVAAFVIGPLLVIAAVPGVHHIDEVVDARAVFDELADSGVAITGRL